MPSRISSHLRRNALAYVALGFSLTGGGVGAAVAATASDSSTIHACVSKRTGALYVARHCSRSERPLSFDQRGPAGAPGATGAQGAIGQAGPAGPAGTPAVNAYGAVFAGSVGPTSGMTITPQSTGVYQVTITAPGCASGSIQEPVVTPNSAPFASGAQSGTPIAYTNFPGPGLTFTVYSGNLSNGTFTPSNEGFDVWDICAR